MIGAFRRSSATIGCPNGLKAGTKDWRKRLLPSEINAFRGDILLEQPLPQFFKCSKSLSGSSVKPHLHRALYAPSGRYG